MASPPRRPPIGFTLCLALWACGCRTAGPVVPMDRLPSQKAAQIVNANATRITGTLRASGSVDGFFTTAEGRRRNYHVDGTMFYLAPTYFRFDLKSLGDRQILLGSNAEYYWVYDKQEDSYYCWHQGSHEGFSADVPVRPDQVIDALALAPIADSKSGLHNNEEEDPLQGRKEYWGDRDSPEVIRQVVFRDASGKVTMQSSLDRYKSISPGGPQLPTVMLAQWPTARARMRFRVDKWTLVEHVGPNGPQFATPAECLQYKDSTPVSAAH